MAYEPDAYLQDDSFDPAKATAAYLRSVFLQNGITAPSNSKKADLVRLYNQQVKPKLADMLAAKKVKASAHGIRDMRNGEAGSVAHRKAAPAGDASDASSDAMDVDPPVATKHPKAAVNGTRAGGRGRGAVKRARGPASRTVSVASSDGEADVAPPKKQLKRPRAKPRRAVDTESPAPAPPEPIKEEDEMDVDVPAPRSSAKRIKLEPTLEGVNEKRSRASLEGRRRSSGHHHTSEDSGFSDFNPFQEGAERKKPRKSSVAPLEPLEPEPLVTHKTSAASRPNLSTSSRRASMPSLRDGPPSAIRKSDAPATEGRPNRPRATLAALPRGADDMTPSASMPVFRNYMPPLEQLKAPVEKVKEIVRRTAPVPSDSSSSPVHHREPLPNRPRRSSVASKPVPQPLPAPRETSLTVKKSPAKTRLARQILLATLFAFLTSAMAVWRQERIERGYCDTGSDTRGKTLTTPSLLGPLEPSCMPCPARGQCSGGELVHCDEDHIRMPRLLSCGGLIPLGDVCVPDTEKLRRVAEQASTITGILRRHRGRIECGQKATTLPVLRGHGRTVSSWRAYGVSEQDLKSDLYEYKDHRVSPEAWNQHFHLAINDLLKHDEIESGQDPDSEVVYYASHAADLPLTCQFRRAAWQTTYRHKGTLLSLFGLFCFYQYVMHWWRSSRDENKQVNELVQLALDKLQEQQFYHYRDPALTTHAWLAPTQLRDQVLSHQLSDVKRTRLWQRVEKIVVRNSNVRRTDADYRGEPTTCWEWIGPVGLFDTDLDELEERAASRRQSRAAPRVSFANVEEKIYPTL